MVRRAAGGRRARRSSSPSSTVVAPALIIGQGDRSSPSLGLLLVAVPAWRLAFDGLTSDPHLEERVLIVGTGPTARIVARRSGRSTTSATASSASSTDQPAGHRTPTWPTPRDRPPTCRDLIASHHIDRIVVGLTDRRGRLPIRELLQAKLSGVRVEDAATTYERMTGKILLDDLKPSWLIFSDGFRASRVTRCVKRAVDLAARASSASSLAAPLMLLTALAIRLDSRRADSLLPGARRRERPRLHAVQVPLDADRRRAGHADLGDGQATTASRGSAASSASRGSTSCRSSGTCCAAT